ncbi:MAG: hypothetical protein GX240_05775 [Candidatus Atribacteria bacterium]|nr:hypothetical protein [Candidatus Atribacteria bacterium]
MRKKIRISLLVLVMFFLVHISVFGSFPGQDGSSLPDGWSSADNVFYKQDAELMIKKSKLEVVKFGFSEKEVVEIMGVPDEIDKESRVYYYRHSPIYFGEDWRVKSWDNRYGNLKVLPEIEKVKLGDHISQVFHLQGFPLRVKEDDKSYQLDYIDQLIYINERWLVEAIQVKTLPEHEKIKPEMSLAEYLSEFAAFLNK